MAFEILNAPKAISSNKPKIIGINDIPSAAQSSIKGEGPIPFIDRLVVTLKVPSAQDGLDMEQAHFDALQDKQMFKPTKPSKGYGKACRIMLPSIPNHEKWPYYEYATDGSTLTRARLDFIPVDIGEMGLEELHEVLTGLMPGGLGYIIDHGRVTRIDIAADFPDAAMTDFHPLPAMGVKYTVRARDGGLQTIELGGPKGNQTVLYDRKAKRIAKGKPWAGKKGVRVERRLRLPNLLLKDLSKLPNPFASVALIAKHVPQAPCEKNLGRWTHFICAAEVMGLAPALALLPTKRRQDYRAHFKSHALDLWQPAALWDAWKDDLVQSRLADSATWKA